ncbi:MAG: HlyD family efflux transporter periplasmic adaptor subunit [Candidatus Nomurabacteria bacterium]
MNKHLEKIINDSKDIKNQLCNWYKELARAKQIGVALVIILIVIMLIRVLAGTTITVEVTNSPRSVKLALVSELANNGSSLPLLGTITSTSEATVRAESSGKLTRVYKKLGDYVSTGTVIAEFENSAERASVMQAEGAYDAAKAARDISRVNGVTTDSSLSDVKTSAINVISSAYINMDDIIHVKTDSAFSNPRNQDAKFNISVPDMSLTLSLEASRKKIEFILIAREIKNRTLTQSSDLISELNTVRTEAETIKSYLDDLATAYSKSLPDNNFSQANIDSAKTIIGGTRLTIAGTISSIVGSRTALNNSLAAQDIAGKTSGTGSSVTTSDAQVKSAEGTYNAALSRLEKTVIRSPINGTLNSLSIETGDFISAFTEVAVVSNNGALEVLAYVTDEDAKRIQNGNEVTINDGIKGMVTRIAGAIDPRTKKIEVRIGIVDKNASLVNGQSVRLNITKAKQVITTISGPIKIPLSALKLTPNGTFVFTISSTSSLVDITVKEGAIMGEEIQILSGLTGNESIVVDARGLKEGTVVTVSQ